MSVTKETVELHVMGEEPTTCPKCGARTIFTEDDNGTQHHGCLNPRCRHEFHVVED